MRRDGESGRSAGRFCDIRYLEATDSTNSDVAALARAGAPEGVVIVTGHQRAGRGRRGRTWTAPPGTALLASVLVRPRLAPSVAPLVGLAAGLAAVEACHDVAGVAPSLKWPNDVVVESPAETVIKTAVTGTKVAEGESRTAVVGAAGAGRAKLAGVLAESVVEGDRLEAVVVGMGLNLRQADLWPADLWPAIVEPGGCSATPRLHNSQATAGAAYLEDLAGRPVDRDDLLHAWLARLDGWCTTLEATGGERAVLEAYRRRCTTLGRLVRVELAGPGDFIDGRAVDVTDGGHLVVESGTARRIVTAGDVVHLRPRSRRF